MKNNSYSSEQYDQRITKDIDTFGWHVAKVMEDEYGPSYAYTIGFNKSFQHPEILIVGPDVDIAHFILNIIGEAILKGTNFIPDSYYPSLIEDAYMYFTAVDQHHYNDYVEHAQHYYANPEFPLLQCVYPAPNGSYPGQAEWPKQLDNLQPYLGNTPIIERKEAISFSEHSIKLPLPIMQ